jgi:hypothetical protein
VQYAAGAEESTSAADKLSAQAAVLKSVIEELALVVPGSQANNDQQAADHKAAATLPSIRHRTETVSVVKTKSDANGETKPRPPKAEPVVAASTKKPDDLTQF